MISGTLRRTAQHDVRKQHSRRLTRQDHSQRLEIIFRWAANHDHIAGIGECKRRLRHTQQDLLELRPDDEKAQPGKLAVIEGRRVVAAQAIARRVKAREQRTSGDRRPPSEPAIGQCILGRHTLHTPHLIA